MTRLRAVLAAAAAGGGGTVVLEGVAGAGKTHLIAAAAELAGDIDALVLRAAASPLSTSSSFGQALDLLAPLLDAGLRGEGLPAPVTAILDPDLAADPDEQTASLACVGLAQLCARAAARRALVLLVDDAHWADPASLQALAAISRQGGGGLALVVAMRLGEQPSDPAAVAELRGDPPATIVRLGPLSPDGVAALLAGAGPGAVDSEAASECARLTGGNPLLVTQVAATFRDREEELSVDGLRRLRGEGLIGVAAAVEARLRRLGEEALALVAACAVLDEETTIRRAALLAGIEQGRAVAAVDRLTAAGVLEPGEPLRFSHPLVRDAVYDARPAAARADEHRRAARLLSADGADPERVASQLLQASPEGSPEAVAVLAAAAEQALARGVPAAAAEYLERAVSEPPAPGQRAETMLRLGFAEALLGRPSAAGWLRRAREQAGTARLRAEADLRLGRHLYAGGSYAAAELALERGRETLAEAGEEGEDDWLAAQLLSASLAAARYAGTIEADERDPRLVAVLDRRTPGKSAAERELLAELAVELGVRGEPCERVVSLAMRAWADGALATSGDRHGIVVSQVAAALVWSDAYEQARRMLDHAIAHSRATGAATGVATARYMRAWANLYGGDLEAAHEDAARALETEGWEMYRPAAHSVIAQVEIERGDLDAAAAALELPGGDGEWLDSIPFALTLEARGRVAALRGDDEAALEQLLACGERVAPMGNHQPYSSWRVEAALCLRRLGEPARAHELAAAELAAARAAGAPRPLGTALLARGALADGERGIPHFEEAVAVLAGSPARLAHARALCRLGERRRQVGPAAAARQPLREALALADELGATLIAAQATAELAAAGARPRRRALRGVDSLTPAELRVARLAAAGCSNREIATELVVAEKTVQFHLTNAYRKLEIDSRAELAAELQVAG